MSKWIEVEDELPPKGTRVLVCDRNGVMSIGSVWAINGNLVYWNTDTTAPVAFWMPLPAAPVKALK